uniref:Uncharacterized protein n=3 Tax=Oryza TaxID=4527 RepID=A0A0E0QWG1_ORYRU
MPNFVSEEPGIRVIVIVAIIRLFEKDQLTLRNRTSASAEFGQINLLIIVLDRSITLEFGFHQNHVYTVSENLQTGEVRRGCSTIFYC